MPETVSQGQPEERVPQGPPPRAHWTLPAVASSLAGIRSVVREFGRAHGAQPAVLVDIALAVTEAATNAVLHAFLDRDAPGTISVTALAGVDELVVIVSDDGRGMQPRADSPGLGLGLPTIGRLTSQLDLREPPGGGTELSMTFAAEGVRGPEHLAAAPGRRHAALLEAVTRTTQGAWPGEGVERLVNLLVPELADACAVDVVGATGRPERFAGRIDGPDAERRSAWLATLRPRTDAPESATRATLDDGSTHISELTPALIARITADGDDAAEMAATGIHWWVVVPLREDERLLGLLHFGMREPRGRPAAELVGLMEDVARRAAHGLANTQLVAELRSMRRRFERILDVLGEAVTVRDARGRMVYANEAAARLLGAASPDELLQAASGELAARFSITREDGSAVALADLPANRLLAGLDAPPLLTRSIDLVTGEERWLLTKATLLEDGETLAVNIIEDVTATRRI
jgi:serine/threonine-protein kinase RsbW